MNKCLLRIKTAFYTEELDSEAIDFLESEGLANNPDLVEFRDALINLEHILFINQALNSDHLTITSTNGEKFTALKTKELVAHLESFMLTES